MGVTWFKFLLWLFKLARALRFSCAHSIEFFIYLVSCYNLRDKIGWLSVGVGIMGKLSISQGRKRIVLAVLVCFAAFAMFLGVFMAPVSAR
jgi:hypothetical protein